MFQRCLAKSPGFRRCTIGPKLVRKGAGLPSIRTALERNRFCSWQSFHLVCSNVPATAIAGYQTSHSFQLRAWIEMRKKLAFPAGVPMTGWTMGRDNNDGFPRGDMLAAHDPPPEVPSFIQSVCGSGFHNLGFRFGRARRARSPRDLANLWQAILLAGRARFFTVETLLPTQGTRSPRLCGRVPGRQTSLLRQRARRW